MSNPQICGPFAQTLFLGASITSFSSSIGWNGDQGSLEVEVVEDPCEGTKLYYDGAGVPHITNQADFFNPPTVGSPVYFKFGDFTFSGILQNWEQTFDINGGKTYSIRCTDPVEILEGCQVIINNYTGSTFGVPNLINAFGYNESIRSFCAANASLASLNPPIGYTPAPAFGGSNVTEDGMSWFQIKNAIEVLTANPSPIYGGTVGLRTTRYFIDISELPTLDANFRLTGDSLTLLEAISQVCSASSKDFFVEALYFAPPYVPEGYGGIAGHIHPDVWKFIKIRTSNRFTQGTAPYNVDLTVNSPIENRLALGKVTAYVGSSLGKTRISRGLELRNDITNSFLIGDNRQDLWQQPYSGSADTYTDTIWPYWGVDNLGFPIISQDVDNEHNFYISTEGWHEDVIAAIAASDPNSNNGTRYKITMLELRAAMAGMEEWALFMISRKPEISEAMNIDASFVKAYVENLWNVNAQMKPDDLKNTEKNAIKKARRQMGAVVEGLELDFDEMQKNLFELVKSYGELAGKKFMVALPLICAAPDANAPFSVKLNWQKSDGAWTDANVQLNAFADPLVPTSPILEKFRGEDGRIECFVYYNTIAAAPDPENNPFKIDYSSLSPDDVVPISDTECYVRATFENITFLNPVAMTYPRAIVSVASQITLLKDKDEPDAPWVDNLLALIADLPIPEDWLVDKKGDKLGDDTNKLPIYPFILMPIGAAIPLRSTNLCYGPWRTTLAFGPAAKTAFERDSSLSPWSFGSTQTMNYAGQIKVETQVTSQIVNESGSLTVPGAPSGRLGSLLIAGGPEITNVDVQVGINGVTSSLRFRTWVPNFGEIGRRRIQTLRTAGTYQQKLQRAFIRNNFAPNKRVRLGNWIRELTKSDRFNRNSSHTIIAAQIIDGYPDTEIKRPNAVMTDIRKVLPEMYVDYEKKALMDLSGLFRPFETSEVTGHGLPFFKEVTPENGQITDQSLNPFKTSEVHNGTSVGHDIEIIARGNSLDDIEDLSIKKEGSHGSGPFRGVGLRFPMVGVGWGFDINDKPVPNADPDNPTDEFANDYLQKPHLWKAGPLDVRWDEERGVWTGGNTSSIRIGTTIDNIMPQSSGRIELITNVLVPESGTVEIYGWDHTMHPGQIIAGGTRVIVATESTSKRYYVLGAACGPG